MRVKRMSAKMCSPEFKEECIALDGRDQRKYVELSRDLGGSADTLRLWYKKAMAEKGKVPKSLATPPAQESTAGVDGGEKAPQFGEGRAWPPESRAGPKRREFTADELHRLVEDQDLRSKDAEYAKYWRDRLIQLRAALRDGP